VSSGGASSAEWTLCDTTGVNAERSACVEINIRSQTTRDLGSIALAA
jgi:hypothetical protein